MSFNKKLNFLFSIMVVAAMLVSVSGARAEEKKSEEFVRKHFFIKGLSGTDVAGQFHGGYLLELKGYLGDKWAASVFGGNGSSGISTFFAFIPFPPFWFLGGIGDIQGDVLGGKVIYYPEVNKGFYYGAAYAKVTAHYERRYAGFSPRYSDVYMAVLGAESGQFFVFNGQIEILPMLITELQSGNSRAGIAVTFGVGLF